MNQIDLLSALINLTFCSAPLCIKLCTSTCFGNCSITVRLIFELLFAGLNDLIDDIYVNFSELSLQKTVDDCVESPQNFSKLGVEMIFNRII